MVERCIRKCVMHKPVSTAQERVETSLPRGSGWRRSTLPVGRAKVGLLFESSPHPSCDAAAVLRAPVGPQRLGGFSCLCAEDHRWGLRVLPKLAAGWLRSTLRRGGGQGWVVRFGQPTFCCGSQMLQRGGSIRALLALSRASGGGEACASGASPGLGVPGRLPDRSPPANEACALFLGGLGREQGAAPTRIALL